MHYVYKLVVGGEPYFGYTSRDPKIRLAEHIKTATTGKWKHRSKLYPVLADMEGDYDSFEIVYEGDSEVNALLTEIGAIRSIGKKNTLNLSDGGEGSTVTVKVDGDKVMVVRRKKATKKIYKPRRRRKRRR